MSTAELMRQARQASGLTFREVAEKAGMDLSVVAQYERGKRLPNPGSLERWKVALKELMASRVAQIASSLTQF